MLILGIETSCDETSVAFLEVKNNNFKVLSQVVSSQVKLHAKFGGVVPVLAARKHSENIDRVFRLALKQSGIKKKPDLIAVTKGPGLAPALLVGVNFAKFLAWSIDRPLIGVNHLEGHIFSNWLKPFGKSSDVNPSADGQMSKKIRFPAVVLIVSGGHTELVLMKGFGRYQLLGQTLDDAVGECFDKVARLLGLGYPGGPIIDKLAKDGDSRAFKFPSPLINSKDFNFSFSGLKTSLLYFLQNNQIDFSKSKLSKNQEQLRKDICASFEEAAIKVLVKKTLRAKDEFCAESILIGGGVAANSFLQKKFSDQAEVIFPRREYITDNAAMIACAGYFSVREYVPADRQVPALGRNCQLKKPDKDSWKDVFAEPNLPLASR